MNVKNAHICCNCQSLLDTCLHVPLSSLKTCIVLLSLLIYSISSEAAVYTVDTPEDYPDANPGDGICRATNDLCTLRAAVEEANRRIGSDTIVLDNYTYSISHKINGNVQPLVIQAATACNIGDISCVTDSNRVTIKGVGRYATNIRLEGIEGRIFFVESDNTVDLQDLRLLDGNMKRAPNDRTFAGGGGGSAIKIAKRAIAIIRNSILENNTSVKSPGGAIYNRGSVYILDSVLSGNGIIDMDDREKSSGGAIYHAGDYANISNSVIKDNEANRGGGINIQYTDTSEQSADLAASVAPRMDIYNSTFQGNRALEGGGGLYDAGSSTNLNNVTFTDNKITGFGGPGGAGIYTTGTPVFYPVYAQTTNREEIGKSIFKDFNGTYRCGSCHVLDDNGYPDFMPNNGNYSDFGLVSKIVYTMPQSDPTVCGVQCAVDVMSYLTGRGVMPLTF